MIKVLKFTKVGLLYYISGNGKKRFNIFQTVSKDSFHVNSQSSIDWTQKKVQRSDCNSPSTKYDIMNPTRLTTRFDGPQAAKTQHELRRSSGENPPGEASQPLFRKVNGISEFNQITHPYNVNPNKDYLMALEQKKHFRKAKGMCSEFAKLAQHQPR